MTPCLVIRTANLKSQVADTAQRSTNKLKRLVIVERIYIEGKIIKCQVRMPFYGHYAAQASHDTLRLPHQGIRNFNEHRRGQFWLQQPKNVHVSDK